MKLTGINWITTYNCNLSCGHCFFDTQQSGSMKYMDAELVEYALSALKETKHMFWQHLSGGEIFLEPEKLFSILTVVNKYFKKNIGLSTNGYWASDYNKTKCVVKKLMAQGVNGIAVSTDYYHQQGMDLKGPKTLVKVIRELNLKTHSYIMGARLLPEVKDAQYINTETENLTLQTDQGYGLPVAMSNERSIGKGCRINQPKKSGIPHGKCTELNTCLGERSPFNPAMVWIDLYGNVMICYGIVIGNLHKSSLQEIIASYDVKKYPLLNSLAINGPKVLYERALELGYHAPGEYFDECDICYQSRQLLQNDYPNLFSPAECYPV